MTHNMLTMLRSSAAGLHKLISKYFTLILTVVVLANVIQLYPSVRLLIGDFLRTGSITTSFVSSRIPSFMSDFGIGEKYLYIPRPDLENKIKLFLDKRPSQYCVVYGAKGVGKSSLMTYVFNKKRGVLKVDVNNLSSREELLSKIARLFKIPPPFTITLDGFVVALRSSSYRRTHPIIVFEIEKSYERAEDYVTLEIVRGLAKAAVPYAHIFIVLSEAHAVLHFNKDSDREDYLHVGEFTLNDAHEFLKKEFNESERQYIFDTVGRRPGTLQTILDMNRRTEPLEEKIQYLLQLATCKLMAFPLQELLYALKKYPDGVSPLYFKKCLENGIDLSDPIAVGRVMKESDVILYRMECQQYELMSTVLKTALKSYTPIRKRS